jgi:hypothetical protein
MAKTSPGAISPSSSTVARNDVSAADNSTVSDANYPPANCCSGAAWKQVVVFPRFTGGTSPTVTVQVLHRVAAVGGNGWLLGPTISPLAEGESDIIEVNGRDFWLRVLSFTGAPTSIDIHIAGWEPFRYDGPKG